MQYDTMLRMLHFFLIVLIHDPNNSDITRTTHLIDIQTQVELLISHDAPLDQAPPYKLYSLSYSLILLRDFYESIPDSDLQLRGAMRFAMQQLSNIQALSRDRKQPVVHIPLPSPIPSWVEELSFTH